MSSLLPFYWRNQTHVAFGVNSIATIRKYVPKGASVLCLFDGDYVDKNGVKQDLENVLDSVGAKFRWRGGIEENPDVSTCTKIAEEIRADPVDFIIPVGGGSVMDASKFISSIVNLPKGIDPWETMRNRKLVKDPIPMIAVCTLAATGSEWDPHFVISNRATGEKISSADYSVCFRLSVLDPRYTLTVPERYTANGLFDSFTHVCEQYVTGHFNPVQDRMSEAILGAIVEVAPKLMKNLNNLNYRATAMQTSALALNDLIGLGTVSCWGTHGIGLSLTAKYGMDHGQTLVTILPWLWRRFYDVKKFKLAQMAERVWGHKGSASIDELAQYSITKTEEYAKMLKFGLKIRDYVKHEKDMAAAVKDLTERTWKQQGCKPFGEKHMITKEDVEEIFSFAF